MLSGLDFGQIAFADRTYLWLLVLPALLLVAWVWRLAARRADTRRLARGRTFPVPQRLGMSGDLPFWLCLVLAIASIILAVSRPSVPGSEVRQNGIDLVVLQDGSASMHVADLAGGDRWQRSMRFLQVLAESLSWQRDRVAMAVFARIAAPQVRLTKDPNTFLFFLEHLQKGSPFPLADDGTWDTNLEQGIHWGLRLIERDRDLYGPSKNAKLFVAVTDGEVWSGVVANELKIAVDQKFPIFVVGVGSLGGGLMPAFVDEGGKEVVLRSKLEREGLQQIASAGGGKYFELDRDPDRDIANEIIETGKRLAPTVELTSQPRELHWYFMCLAAIFAAVGLCFLQDRADLVIQLIGASVVVAVALISFG